MEKGEIKINRHIEILFFEREDNAE